MTHPPVGRFQKMVLRNGSIVWRVDGDGPDGTRYWSIVRVEPPRFQAFQEALESGDLRVQDYGSVLAWGEGEPPGDLSRQIEDKFGIETVDLGPRLEEDGDELDEGPPQPGDSGSGRG